MIRAAGCLMGGTTVGGRTASNLLGQATTAMFMVASTRSSTLHHHNADFNWVELFSSYLFHFALRWCDGKSLLPAV